MADDPAGAGELLAEAARLGTEIQRFAHRHPDHFASRALTAMVVRIEGGENVPVDERILVLSSVVRAIKQFESRRDRCRR